MKRVSLTNYHYVPVAAKGRCLHSRVPLGRRDLLAAVAGK